MPDVPWQDDDFPEEKRIKNQNVADRYGRFILQALLSPGGEFFARVKQMAIEKMPVREMFEELGERALTTLIEKLYIPESEKNLTDF